MNTRVARVPTEIENEVKCIMKKYGVSWSAAMRIWYRQIKNPSWKEI